MSKHCLLFITVLTTAQRVNPTKSIPLTKTLQMVGPAGDVGQYSIILFNLQVVKKIPKFLYHRL